MRRAFEGSRGGEVVKKVERKQEDGPRTFESETLAPFVGGLRPHTPGESQAAKQGESDAPGTLPSHPAFTRELIQRLIISIKKK
jgi:hypothetical protein